jgi:hypothetical protein
MEINVLTNAADALQSGFQSSPKSKPKACSNARVLTDELKQLSYSKGAIYIPSGQEGTLACVANFNGGKLSKEWLSAVKKKLLQNMRKGMSKEKAFYQAIVDTLREGKFKYKKHYAPSASVVPPSEFLRVKIGDCSEFAALIAATAKAFNLDYVYIYNAHHIFSAIVTKEGGKRPVDLKPMKIEVSSRPGKPSKTLYVYPIDVSPAPASGDLKKALKGARGWMQKRLYSTELRFVNSSGTILKHRSQGKQQASMPKLTINLPRLLCRAKSQLSLDIGMYLWRYGIRPKINYNDFQKK